VKRVSAFPVNQIMKDREVEGIYAQYVNKPFRQETFPEKSQLSLIKL
jgi:hypothetical protein